MSDIIKRHLHRSGYCKSCGKRMERGEEIVYVSQMRNQAIFFCMECVSVIAEESTKEIGEQNEGKDIT